MSHSSAPAKLILCGEHAVVYGRPAIALPLASLRARAEVSPGQPGGGVAFAALGLGRSWRAADAPDNPLSALALATLAHLEIGAQDLLLTINSDIPIASGMGSGASVGTAIVRALAAFAGRELSPAQISALVYESERRLHGTPSGIDNTVVAFERPIWFQRGADRKPQTADGRPLFSSADTETTFTAGSSAQPPIVCIPIAAPFTLVIGDTGVRSPTRAPVGDLRGRWQEQPARYEALFDQVGGIVTRARAALATGNIEALGPLLGANHELLQALGVSSPELDRLVRAAQAAGALGAKLSGAGWGGVMLALAPSADAAPALAAALNAAGAARVLTTIVAATEHSDAN